MEIKLKNFNNKLGCDSFVHVAQSPSERIPYSELPKPVTVIDMDTEEKHSCELLYFIRHDAGTLPNAMARLSHNMSDDELLELLKPGERELSSYLYRKIK